MKRLLTALFLLISAAIYAQNATQITEDCIIRGPLTGVAGKYKYSYVVSDEGERIKNGPISITGKENYKYGNVTVTGNYTLTASAKMGLMNGPISVKANYHGVQQRYKTQVVEDYAYSFTGNFLNGIPNGTFTVKATDYGSSTATYKNGVLVGAYSVDETVDKRFIKIKGAFNDKGKMIGVWHFNNLGDESDWEFINGIRIRVSSKKEESTPKQIEMARKYATGAIGLDELKKEGYAPVVDSLRLGDYASDLYFIEVIADWDRLAKCNFGTSYWVKYTYLYSAIPISDKLFSNLLSEFKNNAEERARSSKFHYDELIGRYTVTITDWERHAVVTRSLSDEQTAQINAVTDQYLRDHAYTSIDKLLNDAYYGYFKNIRINTSIDSFNDAARILGKDIPETRDIDRLKKCKADFEKIQGLTLDNSPKTSDGTYYIMDMTDGRQRYLSVEAVTSFNDLCSQVDETLVVLEKKAEEENIANLTKKASSSIDNLLGKELSDFPDKNSRFVLNETTRTYSGEAFSSHVGPFLPFFSYVVEKVQDNGNMINCTCTFKVMQKKQTSEYRVSFNMLKSGEIIIESLNINDAELLRTAELTKEEKKKMKGLKAAKAIGALRSLGF